MSLSAFLWPVCDNKQGGKKKKAHAGDGSKFQADMSDVPHNQL